MHGTSCASSAGAARYSRTTNKGWQLHFKEKELHYVYSGKPDGKPYAVTLDLKAKPRQLIMTYHGKDKFAGLKQYGIFERDGDTLRLAYGIRMKPSSFVTSKETQDVISMVLKRAQE